MKFLSVRLVRKVQEIKIKKAVRKLAIADAHLFFEEWQQPLNPSKTDWDAVAWGESKSVVTALGGDPDEYWGFYSSILEAETERLADEFDAQFEIEASEWSSTKVTEVKIVPAEDAIANTRLPKIRITFLESEEKGIYLNETEVINKLREIDPTLSYKFNSLAWDSAEDDWSLGMIETSPISEGERLAYELAQACGLEVIKA